MNPVISLRRALATACIALAGCAGPGARPAPPASAPLADALAMMGAVQVVDGASSPEVVLLKDRHAVGQGIFQVDEELRAFQRDQHAVVSCLVARGFTLLGCEHTLGPLPRNAAAEDHIEKIRQIRAGGDDLNGWAVYQPLRYEVEFPGRLAVLGVEDPGLYQQDLDTLAMIEKVRHARRFNDAQGPRPEALAQEELRLLRKISANVTARGEAAARNLVAAMRERGCEKAILMLGASHIPGASAELRRGSIRHYVFEAPSFRRKGAE